MHFIQALEALVGLIAVGVLNIIIWVPMFWLLHVLDASSARPATGTSRDDYLGGYRHAKMDEHLNGFEGGSYEPMYDDHDGNGE